ncbi:MAG: hypothetical protein QOE09_1833 [Ilumatobacteraceae bacterium]|jgi:hypothetical protein
MRPIVVGLFASITALTLLPACGSNTKTAATADTNVTAATGGTAPGYTFADEVSVPSGASVPTDFTVPQQTIDLMIKQFEAAGMKVDKACFTALLSDDSVRKLVQAGSSGTPTAELTQKFFTCLST